MSRLRQPRYLAVLGFCALAVLQTAAGAETGACTAGAMKVYPTSEIIRARADKIALANMFYAPPGEKPLFRHASPEQVARGRSELARALGDHPADERTILLLGAFDIWTQKGRALAAFFNAPSGDFLDEVRSALNQAGLSRHVALLDEGRAAFGAAYSPQAQRTGRLRDGQGNIRDAALNDALENLTARFRDLPSALDAATAEIARSPELAARYASLRATVSETDRLNFLGYRVWECMDAHATPESLERYLAGLPEAIADFAVLFVLNGELRGGSTVPLFTSPAGALIPRAIAVLRRLGAAPQADGLEQAMAKFPKPYPPTPEARRAAMNADPSIAPQLHRLGLLFDRGELAQAAASLARDTRILPQ